MKIYTGATFTGLALLSSVSANPVLRERLTSDNDSMVYDFGRLTSSTDLKWTPCFRQFTCALLKVPLDYEEPSVGTTDIAFIKWSTNATANASTQDILINPGGPGGSGVEYLKTSLSIIQSYVGTAHSIIGFDPRGVNNSGPDLSCFPGKIGTQRFYDPALQNPLDLNNTGTIADTFARAGAVGEWCSRVHSGANSPVKYANTVATATDMLTFVEADAAAKGKTKGEAKLSYYGVSYGTVLGSTFAALFPKRIERMILDAVVDPDDYYQGKWANNLPDADGAVRTFFTACHQGGNTSCPLWADTPEGVEKRFTAIYADLAANPIPISDPKYVSTPSIVTIANLKTVVVQAVYSPVELYPLLADIMASVEQRNGTSLARYSGIFRRDVDSCSNDTSGWEGSDVEPRFYIACNDANRRFNISTIANFTAYARQQYALSQYVGEYWATGTAVICRQLVVDPPESQIFPSVFPAVNATSAPILFVGNTLDPVTPLRHAKKMHGLFAGSGLLTQDSPGHTALAAKSVCTSQYLKEYIRSGELPPEGTVCKVEQVAFQEGGSGNGATAMLTKRHLIGM